MLKWLFCEPQATINCNYQKLHLILIIKITKMGTFHHGLFLKCKYVKLKLRVCLVVHTVAMLIYTWNGNDKAGSQMILLLQLTLGCESVGIS